MQGTVIIAAFVILFTALAGMASVAYMDVVIGILITIIGFIALPVLLGRIGGWAGLHAALARNALYPVCRRMGRKHPGRLRDAPARKH